MAPKATAPADTFPKLLLRNARLHAGRPAYRHKDLGIWQVWTWSQVLDEARAYAAGLLRLGLERWCPRNPLEREKQFAAFVRILWQKVRDHRREVDRLIDDERLPVPIDDWPSCGQRRLLRDVVLSGAP